MPVRFWTEADDRLFDVIGSDGAVARFVGGCVRDSLLGRPAGDVDLATDARPERVLALLRQAGVRTIETGLAHGTVTAVPAGRPVQITTLRRDIVTDGRHATVAYTEDWAEDAARRDFTINALSADRDGSVHDYVGGVEDLGAGRVRFIGTAADRIAEDHLRILRFFRIHAWYATAPADADALAACAGAADRLDRLSGERVWGELSRILPVPCPGTIFAMMERAGILERLLPGARRPDRIEVLATLERRKSIEPQPLRRLAGLTDLTEEKVAALGRRLRLSRTDLKRLRALARGRGTVGPSSGDVGARRVFYDVGGDLFRDLVLLEWAEQAAGDPDAARKRDATWDDLLRIGDASPMPRFPLTGHDVRNAGIADGPAIGICLHKVEDWWIEEGLRPDRAACLERLREVVEDRRLSGG